MVCVLVGLYLRTRRKVWTGGVEKVESTTIDSHRQIIQSFHCSLNVSEHTSNSKETYSILLSHKTRSSP